MAKMWSTSSERVAFRGEASCSVFTYRTRRFLPGVGTLRTDCVELGGEGRLCIDLDVPRRGVQGNVAISSADSVSSGWLCTLCVGDADVDAISASSPSHPLERRRHRQLHNGTPCIVSGRWDFAWHHPSRPTSAPRGDTAASRVGGCIRCLGSQLRQLPNYEQHVLHDCRYVR